MFAYKLNKCNICLAFTDSDTKEISDEQLTEDEPSYSVEDIMHSEKCPNSSRSV